MDSRRFDALTRSLAGSRRRALKLALGGVLAALGHRATAVAKPPFPVPPQDRCRGPGHRCAHGAVCCNGACVDTQSDPHNCGGCGVDCGGNTCCQGTCVDTSSDMSNCGACGAVCTLDLCDQGRCGCGQGSEACNGACVDTTADPRNCGACGHDCGENTRCVNGACCGVYGAACETPADCCGFNPTAGFFGQPTCADGICRCCQGGELACGGTSSSATCCIEPTDIRFCCTKPFSETSCTDPTNQCVSLCVPNPNPDVGCAGPPQCPEGFPYLNEGGYCAGSANDCYPGT